MDKDFELSLRLKLDERVKPLVDIPKEGVREDDELDLLTKTIKTTEAGKDLIKQQEKYENEVRKLEERRRRMNLRRMEFLEDKKRHESKLKENELIRIEAETQTQLHRKEIESLKNELEKLRLDLLEAEKDAQRLEEQLRENRCFAEFMTKVSQCEKTFESVDDVMKRYESLTAVLNHLLEKRRNLKEKLVKEQQEEANFNLVQSTELLKCTEKLSALKLEEEKLRLKLEERENYLELIEKEWRDNLIIRKKIKMAIKNMYGLVTAFTKSTGALAKTEDPVKQLFEIDQFITKWSDIVDILKSEDSSNSLRALASQSN